MDQEVALSVFPAPARLYPLLAGFILSAAPGATAGGAAVWRINCGGPAYDSPRWIASDRDNLAYANPDKKLHWMADTFFTGGGPYSQKNAISSSEADTLFQTERWNPDGADGAKYAIPVPNGEYRVGMYFAEISPDEAGVGKRVFNVILNGEKVLENFDIFQLSGSNQAMRVEKPVEVVDGKIRISFENVSHHAKISGIEILRAPIPYSETAPYRIDCGGEDDWYDKQGIGWQSDSHWYGGSLAGSTVAITGTENQVLFQSERWANPKEGDLMYEFGLEPGDYSVRLHFAEPWDVAKGVGKRIFNVKINNKVVLDHFDIFAEGGYAKEVIKEIPWTATGANAKAQILFENVVHEAKIDAIEILPAKSTGLGGVPVNRHMKAASALQIKDRDALGRKTLGGSPRAGISTQLH